MRLRPPGACVRMSRSQSSTHSISCSRVTEVSCVLGSEPGQRVVGRALQALARAVGTLSDGMAGVAVLALRADRLATRTGSFRVERVGPQSVELAAEQPDHLTFRAH